MKKGTVVLFITNNKLKEGIVLKNNSNGVFVKTKRRRYHLNRYQLARKETK